MQLRFLGVLLIFTVFSFAFSENLLCTEWNEGGVFYTNIQDPFIGFTEKVVVNGVTYAGWYIVEADLASALPFKAYFFQGVYTDGIEIGERFETLSDDWRSTPFMDFSDMGAAFSYLSSHAPVCTTSIATN